MEPSPHLTGLIGDVGLLGRVPLGAGDAAHCAHIGYLGNPLRQLF